MLTLARLVGSAAIPAGISPALQLAAATGGWLACAKNAVGTLTNYGRTAARLPTPSRMAWVDGYALCALVCGQNSSGLGWWGREGEHPLGIPRGGALHPWQLVRGGGRQPGAEGARTLCVGGAGSLSISRACRWWPQ